MITAMPSTGHSFEVQFERVWKRFGGTTALAEFTLTVRAGELLALLGPSGSGKTTALRILAGLEEETAGDIYIGEERVNETPARRRDVAMVFQNYALYPHMNVRDNLAYPLKLRGMSSAERTGRVQEVANLLQIHQLLHRRPRELSGGQAQRVALGRAIIRHPRVFLMDEPLSNLDAKLRMETRGEIKRLHATIGVTTLFVTHDQEEAMVLGDRIAVMRDGRLLQVGTPQELYYRPQTAFVAGFLGRPAMNLLRGHLDLIEGAPSVSIGGVSFAVETVDASSLASGPVVIGIRPEDVFVEPVVIGPGNMRVDVVQPVEPDTLLSLSYPGGIVTARLTGDAAFHMDQQVTVSFPRDRIYLFDVESGDLLMEASRLRQQSARSVTQ